MPGEPAGDVAEEQLARLRPAPQRRSRPRTARRASARRRWGRARARSLADAGRLRPAAHLRAQLARALVLPAHHRRDGPPAVALPEHERLRLVRDADRADGGPVARNDFGDRLQRPGEQLVGIVLDHARRGAPGRHRPDGGAPLLQAPVVRDAARARASLVESEDHLRRHAACLSGRLPAVRSTRCEGHSGSVGKRLISSRNSSRDVNAVSGKSEKSPSTPSL